MVCLPSAVFIKKIKNFIYTRSAYLLNGTATDPKNFDSLYPELADYNINYPLNSPNDATIKGIEFDLQLQFRKLNNFLKGVVLSANLSLMVQKELLRDIERKRSQSQLYYGRNRKTIHPDQFRNRLYGQTIEPTVFTF